MDRFLKPERFDADPSNSTASKEWIHWFKTFNNFISAIEANEHTPDKFNVLTNFVSPTVYEFIAECSNYKSAIKTLQDIYIKPISEIFARHLLASRKQDAGETLDQYLQALKQLSKDCNFQDVTAVLHREYSIRDAFISGLQSSHIRQRLLENQTLDLQTAFDQARALEMAHKPQKRSNEIYYMDSAEENLRSAQKRRLMSTRKHNDSLRKGGQLAPSRDDLSCVLTTLRAVLERLKSIEDKLDESMKTHEMKIRELETKVNAMKAAAGVAVTLVPIPDSFDF